MNNVDWEYFLSSFMDQFFLGEYIAIITYIIMGDHLEFVNYKI